jgi:two-component system chemotaxis response regulator CheB
LDLCEEGLVMISLNQQAPDIKEKKSSLAYKVMVVDDSALLVGLIKKKLVADPLIDIVATASNGESAIRRLTEFPDIEIVILDIEMPILDGISAIPRLLEKKPDLKIIMSSTLTKRNAEISLSALKAGASDYIAKPQTREDGQQDDSFFRDLIYKVKTFGAQYRRSQNLPLPESEEVKKSGIDSTIPKNVYSLGKSIEPIILRKMPTVFFPKVVSIGSSTGGPQALMTILPHLKGIGMPIVITQHMPSTFTMILAEHICKNIGLECKEAQEGDLVEAGKVYLAPGDYHMGFKKTASGQFQVALSNGPQINYCRPAVDYMLQSLRECVEPKSIMTIILTGMGQDGMLESKAIADQGGIVIAQDEKTSVVWGMPGAVAAIGACHAIEPLENIGKVARKLIG